MPYNDKTEPLLGVPQPQSVTTLTWSGFNDENEGDYDVDHLGETEPGPPVLRGRGESSGSEVEAGDEGTASSSGVAPRLIVSYGLGHVLNDLSASIWFFYAVIYCQQVLGIPPDTTGAVVLIGQVVDGLTTPLVGYASDHTRTPIGPRKPWHIFGVCCVAITFPLVFGGCSIGAEPGNALRAFCPLKPWQGGKAQMGLLVFFISLFQIGWASSQVSHLALMPDLSKSKRERTTLSSVRYGVTVACNIFVLLALSVLLAREREASGGGSGGEGCEGGVELTAADQPLFQSLSWTVAAVGVLAACGFYAGVPSHPRGRGGSRNEPRLSSSGSPLPDASIFEDALFWKHGLLYMLARLMINLNMVYMPLYVQSTMRMRRNAIAVIPLLMYVLSLLGSGIQNVMNEKFGRVQAFSIGGALQVVGSLALFFLPRRVSWMMYVIAPLIGLAGTSMLVTVISMTSDFIGRRNLSAKVFGLYSFSDKLCSGIAVYAIQSSLRCGDCCTNPSCCSVFYRYVLGLVPLGAAVVSFAILLLWRWSKLRRRATVMKRDQSTLLLDPTDSIADVKTWSYGGLGEKEGEGGR